MVAHWWRRGGSAVRMQVAIQLGDEAQRGLGHGLRAVAGDAEAPCGCS